MKILYHHRTRAEDAQGIHITELVRAFRKLGHKVTVVGLIEPGTASTGSSISRFASLVPAWAYEVLELLYNVYGFFVLRAEVRREKPDFLYERYALHNVSGVFVSAFCKIPLILEVNAPLALEKAMYGSLVMGKLARLTERFICSRAHRTIVVSTPLKKILMASGVPEEKIVVMPNGINPDHFSAQDSGVAVRERYGLQGKIVLGFVGWFRKWHGLEELLEVFCKHGMADRGMHIMLVGDGPACSDLERYARAKGIYGSGVTFTGPVSRQEVPEYIAAFDVALQPDVTDYASPMKLFEYMAMGKGVIAPNKENMLEIFGAGYGALFSGSDPEDMARVMLACASDTHQPRALGAKASSILRERSYYWTTNAKGVLALV
ncbi:glycosyltransferase family 4 protein [Desulfoluna spongiiphila]|uniref:glycosyltransferase family 4 protein n=1 Tax=Desulfoluna spongiiphila TaxID=419481 RepID=UPI001254F7C3|nr:glycosyltransferase family 4 protein [Desulfoluna spongiiphila]VVS93990.1 glycosyl transferases group 1 [Desulfoluna spongiiphila]